MWSDNIHNFIQSPITGLILTVILSAIAFSGKFSITISNILLLGAFFVGSFEIFRYGLGVHLSIIFCLLLGIALVAISWWIQPNEKKTGIPQLQVTPVNIEERLDSTILEFHVLNYSNYVAKNISVDIKFGNSLWWKKDLWKASSQDTQNKLLKEKNDQLMAKILSQTSEEKLKEIHNNHLNRPLLNELKPGVKIKAWTMDVNKDWALKQKVFFTANGKTTPIKPEENPDFQESQGWKEQIDNTESGKPIEILLRVVLENEIGKKSDQIFKYQLIVTKIGTGKSYN